MSEQTNTTKQMSLEAEHELTNKHYETDEPNITGPFWDI